MARDPGLKPQLNSLDDMRASVFLDGPTSHQQHTRFWLLLVLSSVIAAAGVVADSTATVIGAMIVAPLMTPIQGTMLSTVLADRRNLIRSLGLLIAGAATAIVIGWMLGLVVVNDVVAATNTQVAGRVNPGLIDLIAALGTGVVGSIALVRKDIADTLPGVAIAISLVPPLVVVGLTVESGAWNEATGALLLFATNVAAIIATGIVVMAVYGAGRLSPPAVEHHAVVGRRLQTTLLVGALAAIILVPLGLSTYTSVVATTRESTVHRVVEDWAAENGWRLLTVTTTPDDGVLARVEGEPPAPDTAALASALGDADVAAADVTVDFVPVTSIRLGG